MCGIVGITGVEGAAGAVYKRLKLLEYRGYDSAGIASLSDGGFSLCKRRGRVYSLGGDIKHLHGKTAIGHTRWATHGKPSDENAHPHIFGKFAVVHNGIIENYAHLKDKYFSGVEFNSETDSEVAVRLLQHFYDGDILSAVKKTVKLLVGSFALVIMCSDFDGIIVAKNKNPAIIGYGVGANYCASDAPALAGLCSEITVLSDGDIAVLTSDEVTIYDGDLKRVVREKIKNPALASELDLNGCPHYMLKEIREVPQSVTKTCDAYVCTSDKLRKYLKGIERIIITGCGTAYNSGLIGKRYFESFAGIPVEVETAGEFRYKQPIITDKTAVIAISQSGETADTVEAAKLVKNLGGKVIAVTNSPYSELTRIADAVVPVEAGQEICVAATKSYTGQIAALYLLALTVAGKDVADGAKKLYSVSELTKNLIEHTDIGSLADMCARSDGVYFLGRDLDYAVATEGSLKLKEISYIPSEGYPAGELKHGTLALIDIRTTSVVIITDKSLAPKSENAVEQILSRRGKVAVITNLKDVAEELKEKALILEIPECDKYLSPILSAVIVQLLAYKTSLLLCRDPDKPRNLAKSVTVE
ncbi:MAG: glutamine--fructose-6-phosphate transaminase (isomerizing) [Clostridia bacterium]|nr:glutamine--fructose-6-phosphate transaminase (isomerizing) [Clostridia bacterium]